MVCRHYGCTGEARAPWDENAAVQASDLCAECAPAYLCADCGRTFGHRVWVADEPHYRSLADLYDSVRCYRRCWDCHRVAFCDACGEATGDGRCADCRERECPSCSDVQSLLADLCGECGYCRDSCCSCEDDRDYDDGDPDYDEVYGCSCDGCRANAEWVRAHPDGV
jgi:membrane protease subunit (stomatin/prohibitin family)